MRYILADLTLGAPVDSYRARAGDPDAAEALSLWDAGVRAANAGEFEVRDRPDRFVVYRGTRREIDGMQVRLSSDLSLAEDRVRYVLADIALGGSVDFYRKVADTSHDPISIEAFGRSHGPRRLLDWSRDEITRLGRSPADVKARILGDIAFLQAETR